MNNLRKFATEADYSAATLNYPAVSWVVSGDTVHFDKSAPTPPVVNDKVIMASYGGDGTVEFVFYNCAASSSGDITSITLDDVAVNPIVCQTPSSDIDASQVHIAKYTLNTTGIDDWFGGDLGCSAASTPSNLDILIPSQITAIYYLPYHIVNMVVLVEDPTTIWFNISGFDGNSVYVPDASVNAYKAASGWSDFAEKIHPISEYSGNLPV